MPNSSTFMPQFKNDAETTLKSGVKVRLFRAEPFKFMQDITGWLASINAGEIQAFHMNTDANGWVNFAIAYREYLPAPLEASVDPIVVLYDTVALLRDLAAIIKDLEASQRSKKELKSPKVPGPVGQNGPSAFMDPGV